MVLILKQTSLSCGFVSTIVFLLTVFLLGVRLFAFLGFMSTARRIAHRERVGAVWGRALFHFFPALFFFRRCECLQQQA